MKLKPIFSLLLVLITFSLSAQFKVVGNVTASFDTFKFSEKRPVKFAKFRQADNFLLGYDTSNVVYKSTDFGKTWSFLIASGDLMTVQNGKIRMYNRHPVNSGGGRVSLNCYNSFTDYIVTFSDDLGKTFTGYYYNKYYDYWCIQGTHFNTTNVWKPRIIDSLYFTVTHILESVNSRSAFAYLPPNSISTVEFDAIKSSNPNEKLPLTYAANNHSVINGKIYKNANIVNLNPYRNIDSTILGKNYAIAEKKGVTYVYITKDSVTKVRTTSNNGSTWQEATLPITLLNKNSESAIIQDSQYLYAFTPNGIFRSDDPLFAQSKNVYNADLNVRAFSITTSGIYMTNSTNNIVRSTDNGDTWQTIGQPDGSSRLFSLVAYDNRAHFEKNQDDNFVLESTNFNNYESVSFKKSPNVYISSEYPFLKGYKWINNNPRLNTYIVANYASNSNTDNWFRVGPKFANVPDNLIVYQNSLLYFDKSEDGLSYRLFESKDFAQTWQTRPLGINPPCTIQKVFIDEAFLIIVTKCGDIYQSGDNGATWTQFAVGDANAQILNIDKYKEFLLAVVKTNTVQGAIVSNDKGLTWHKITNFPYNKFTINGDYVYTGNDENFLRVRADSLFNQVNSDAFYGILKGQIYIDANSNCVKDTNETTLSEKVVKIEPNAYSTITNKNGQFAIALPPNTYSVTTISNIRYHVLGCGDTILKNVVVKVNDTKDTSLVFKPIPNIHDLAITVTAVTPARNGFALDFVLTIDNVGTTNVDSAFLSFRIPTQFTAFTSASQGGIFSNGQVTWLLRNIIKGEKRQISVRLRVNADTPLSTNLSFTGKVTPLGKTDAEPKDNEDVTMLTVRGSFDPNDKTVMPEGKIPFFTNELDYLIRFQNTGTDTAFKVVIVDTLPTNLDVFTMKIVSASHPYTVSLSKKNIVVFTFDNILLVDSFTNEKGSHGFIRFKIAPKKGLIAGDNISNKAAIYFDYNKPIITNIAKSELIKPIITIKNSVNLCRGSQYKGENYFFSRVLSETFVGRLYDTTYETTIVIKPTYNIDRDTILKQNELFEGRIVINGEIVTKVFKTKEWGCDSIVNFKIQKVNATNELLTEFASFNLYPNPTSDYLSMLYELRKTTWVTIDLYNAVGQKVKILQEKTQNTEGVYQLTEDIKDLDAGIYQIAIQTEKGIFYRKFVKI